MNLAHDFGDRAPTAEVWLVLGLHFVDDDFLHIESSVDPDQSLDLALWLYGLL